jgi:glycosyltransferase involved in cell wall biosynthesis
MRIAQITPVYPPYRGGIGTVAAQYAQELRSAGEAVTVFTPDYHHGERVEPNVERLRPLLAWGNAAVLPSLLWRLRSFTVWHLHYPFFGSDFLVALAAMIWRRKLIVTFHMRPLASGWLGAIFYWYQRIFEWLVLGRAQSVLVSSIDYANSIGLSRPNLVEQPFGADATRFHPGHDLELRAQLGIGPNEVVLLFVGGLDRAHYFKGVDVLLKAAAQLGLDRPWRLLIVGDGELKSQYQALGQLLALSKRVIFTGSVPFDQLPHYYRAADIHVLPSIDRSEAWGLVTVEAQLSGLPSVVSDLPGVRTVIEPGLTGLLVPPNDVAGLASVMKKLIDEEPLRLQFLDRALERAKNRFDQRKLLARLISVYKGDTVGLIN